MLVGDVNQEVHENPISHEVRRFAPKERKSAISVNDPFCDAISRLRNAYTELHMEHAFLIKNKLVTKVMEKLYQLGYVGKVEEMGAHLKVELIKNERQGKQGNGITYMKVMSTPGRRVYVSYRDIPRSKYGVAGEFLLSTTDGIITDREARLRKKGGQLLMEVFSCQRWMNAKK